MKLLMSLFVLVPILAGCISSSSPPAPAKTVTVVVPQNSDAVVICSDGTNPPCR